MELSEILYRMKNEKIYFCDSEELAKQQTEALEKQYDYNFSRPSETEKRAALLKEMFAEIGEGCYIEPPLHSNWGGKNVHFGKHIYANFGLTLVDDTDIYVGDHVMLGPNVVLSAGAHPVSPELRKKEGQYNKSIRIGSNVWIGAAAVILPGITIGDNSVIGAGSVVTKDIPANVVAAGVPCRVIREISDFDRKYYDKDKLIDV